MQKTTKREPVKQQIPGVAPGSMTPEEIFALLQQVQAELEEKNKIIASQAAREKAATACHLGGYVSKSGSKVLTITAKYDVTTGQWSGGRFGGQASVSDALSKAIRDEVQALGQVGFSVKSASTGKYEPLLVDAADIFPALVVEPDTAIKV